MTAPKPSARSRPAPAPDARRNLSQRDLVAASLLRAPLPSRSWDERTRPEYRPK